ncbi:hypothetical protein [Terrimonas ferruginea]|uniref:hypothetical protein n=1 Tax=Terrimonas ferruginea TaxID=249 RepID=UPI00042A8308|nr:hypothetical protein [Terrimonas ferruginea]
MQKWSASVDRHLQELVTEGVLEKLSGGVYYVPKKSVFGKAPADEKNLVRSFLKDSRFVIVSPNDYNMLGLGTTQLYNFRKVYNYKRHGSFKLGNRLFHFIRKQRVPDVLTAEFLLIDLLNNINDLAEDQPSLLSNIVKKIKKMDAGKLRRLAQDYGTVGTRKFLEQVPA